MLVDTLLSNTDKYQVKYRAMKKKEGERNEAFSRLPTMVLRKFDNTMYILFGRVRYTLMSPASMSLLTYTLAV